MKSLFRLTGAITIIALLSFQQIVVLYAEEQPKITLNELMWMGSSASSSDEWIELYNDGATSVDISGWSLTKWSSEEERRMLDISSGEIAPGEYFLISNYDLGHENTRLAIQPDLVVAAMSLSNSTLRIALYDANGNIIDVAGDSGKPLGGSYTSGEEWASMERMPGTPAGDDEASWYAASESVNFLDEMLEKGTPGATNSNIPPIAEAGDDQEGETDETLTFDGSASSDPEGGELTFLWDFGDDETAEGEVIEYTYSEAGEYTVTLMVSDGLTEAEDSLLVTVTEAEEETPPLEKEPLKLEDGEDEKPKQEAPKKTKDSKEDDTEETGNDDTQTSECEKGTSEDILISELLPNPEGSDEEGEYIELMNIGDDDIDLCGWVIADPKKEHVLGAVIEAGRFLELPRTETGIALNNNGDTIFLYDPFGKPVNGVEYDSSSSGRSFSRIDSSDEWGWSDPTPGEKNMIPDVEDEAEEDEASEEDEEEEVVVDLLLSIREVRGLDVRSSVTVEGVVMVEPDILGKQFFYIADGEAGIQVYSSKSDFPKLAVGDVVEVTGKTGEAHNETKVNVSSSDDIDVVGSTSVGEADMVNAFDEDVEGMLVVIEGDIASKQGSSFDVDTGSDTVKISLKRSTGISIKEYAVDDHVTVTGIVTEDKDGYRLLPRYETDIVNEESVEEDKDDESSAVGQTDEGGSQGTVQGASEVVDTEPVSQNGIIIGMAVAGAVLFGARTAYKNRDRIMRFLKSLKRKNAPGGNPPGES